MDEAELAKYERLITTIAKRFPVRGACDLEDLIQEGWIGALRALSKPKPNYNLAQYVGIWALAKMHRFFARSAGAVIVPAWVYDLAISKTRIKNLSKRRTELVWLAKAALAPSEDLGDLEDRPVEEDAEELIDFRGLIRQALEEVLDERRKIIIDLRYGITDGTPKTLEAIGKITYLTRERVRQLENESLRKLQLWLQPRLAGEKPPEENPPVKLSYLKPEYAEAMKALTHKKARRDPASVHEEVMERRRRKRLKQNRLAVFCLSCGKQVYVSRQAIERGDTCVFCGGTLKRKFHSKPRRCECVLCGVTLGKGNDTHFCSLERCQRAFKALRVARVSITGVIGASSEGDLIVVLARSKGILLEHKIDLLKFTVTTTQLGG